MENVKTGDEKMRDLKSLFYESIEYKKLVEGRNKYLAKLDHVNAAVMNKRINEAWMDFLRGYRRKALGIEGFIGKMDEEDRKHGFIDLLTIMMMTNILDFVVADLNELFKKYDKDAKFSGFKKLIELSKECAVQVKMVCDKSDYEFNDRFAEFSDELQEMIQSKVEETLYNYLKNRKEV